jgi:hypothetical protein
VAFVVFGRSGSYPAVLSLSVLDGSNGFRINAGGEGGIAVASGDMNGDGASDVIIGAPLNDAVYTIFGKH